MEHNDHSRASSGSVMGKAVATGAVNFQEFLKLDGRTNVNMGYSLSGDTGNIPAMRGYLWASTSSSKSALMLSHPLHPVLTHPSSCGPCWDAVGWAPPGLSPLRSCSPNPPNPFSPLLQAWAWFSLTVVPTAWYTIDPHTPTFWLRLPLQQITTSPTRAV